MRYACIHRHTDTYTVALMCRVLRVSRAGYYAWCCRPPSARTQANRHLLTAICAVHRHSRATYGSPRVTRELQAQGHRCSEPRVARLMRLAGVQAKRRRRFRVTTDSRHGEPVAPNRLQRQFAVAAIPGLNRVWASAICRASSVRPRSSV